MFQTFDSDRLQKKYLLCYSINTDTYMCMYVQVKFKNVFATHYMICLLLCNKLLQNLAYNSKRLLFHSLFPRSVHSLARSFSSGSLIRLQSRSISKLTHMVVGKIQFLTIYSNEDLFFTGCWPETTFKSLPHWPLCMEAHSMRAGFHQHKPVREQDSTNKIEARVFL